MTGGKKPRIWIGAIALCLMMGGFSNFFFGKGDESIENQVGMVLGASFLSADGIKEGSSVRLSGVEVGTVNNIELTATYSALVSISFFDQNISLLDDTAAVIETDGIFGEKYIELYQGGSLSVLEKGQRIRYTQDSVRLESILIKILDSIRNRDDNKVENTL